MAFLACASLELVHWNILLLETLVDTRDLGRNVVLNHHSLFYVKSNELQLV